jgi:hypothetical protein
VLPQRRQQVSGEVRERTMARNPIIEVSISSEPGSQLKIKRLDSGEKTYNVSGWTRAYRAWWFYHNAWRSKFHGSPNDKTAFHLG